MKKMCKKLPKHLHERLENFFYELEADIECEMNAAIIQKGVYAGDKGWKRFRFTKNDKSLCFAEVLKIYNNALSSFTRKK